MQQTDQLLVDQCRSGDREAFAEIVRRYQTLVCSVAYGATGNLSCSEELAQEAFVSAWRSMHQLREPNKLRQWLCGIVRRLASNHARRQYRDVLWRAASIDLATLGGGASDPVEATIAREEAELLDRTLAAMPQQYREPLVLFHRESQSVASVAALLELSQDAVKQRLARGRQMLRDEVAAIVERGLRRSVPGRAFTIGVLAALPVMTGTAKAATITATSAKGMSAMSGAGWTGAVGTILGPLAGFLGAWFGYSMSMKSARSQRERGFIRRLTLWVLGLAMALAAGLTLLLLNGQEWLARHPNRFTLSVSGLVIGYVLALLGTIVWGNRRIAQIRREDGTVDVPVDKLDDRLPARLRHLQYPHVYETKARLFGLPLVSVCFEGASAIGRRKRRSAVGWIAIGDKAYGILFASGSLAVGTIAVGGMGVGLVSISGLAIGALAVGGAAVGWWSIGGLAVGWLAFAGIALAWKAAMGGLALAHGFAVGGLAAGDQVNNEFAKAFVGDSAFFDLGNTLTSPWLWWVLVVIALAPTILALQLVAPRNPGRSASMPDE